MQQQLSSLRDDIVAKDAALRQLAHQKDSVEQQLRRAESEAGRAQSQGQVVEDLRRGLQEANADVKRWVHKCREQEQQLREQEDELSRLTEKVVVCVMVDSRIPRSGHSVCVCVSLSCGHIQFVGWVISHVLSPPTEYSTGRATGAPGFRFGGCLHLEATAANLGRGDQGQRSCIFCAVTVEQCTTSHWNICCLSGIVQMFEIVMLFCSFSPPSLSSRTSKEIDLA